MIDHSRIPHRITEEYRAEHGLEPGYRPEPEFDVIVDPATVTIPRRNPRPPKRGRLDWLGGAMGSEPIVNRDPGDEAMIRSAIGSMSLSGIDVPYEDAARIFDEVKEEPLIDLDSDDKPTGMRHNIESHIASIEIKKLVSFGNYENLTIGAMAWTDAGDDPDVVFDALEDWVDTKIANRVKEDKTIRSLYDAENNLRDIERSVHDAEEQYERIRRWLTDRNIPLPNSWKDDMPF